MYNCKFFLFIGGFRWTRARGWVWEQGRCLWTSSKSDCQHSNSTGKCWRKYQQEIIGSDKAKCRRSEFEILRMNGNMLNQIIGINDDWQNHKVFVLHSILIEWEFQLLVLIYMYYLCNNQELLWSVIISHILVTLMFNSGLIL